MGLIEPILTTGDVRARFGYSESSLRRWAALGRGPKCHTTESGALRYKLSDVEKWSKRKAVKQAPRTVLVEMG